MTFERVIYTTIGENGIVEGAKKTSKMGKRFFTQAYLIFMKEITRPPLKYGAAEFFFINGIL
ncbi:hypothetical protein PY093_09385 [Cytobacillus sp. S13-E01]|uniref:hypothetical protein n=1 Tax=Cytobacillus sp. S13-E01 TaxID=3031326 RepID=UPI0023D7CB30|nr:hypothetical protein [Cytobacillus sp. S13-E01]MDF0726927.1 hypothetical protein [Cytobacillus sp. S13-E01]